jgi:hypothetical protein
MLATPSGRTQSRAGDPTGSSTVSQPAKRRVIARSIGLPRPDSRVASLGLVPDRKEVTVKRTTLAVALATGALAVPAVSLAAGGDDPATQTPSTTPVQEQEQQPPSRGDDCPEHEGGGGGSSSSETQL